MMILETQRRMTEEYIKYDPTSIVLIPTVETVSPSGGRTIASGTPRAVQTFKLIALAYNQRPTVTVDGVERVIDYHLLGRHDAIMEPGDFWVSSGDRFQIISIDAGHGYEKKGFVERRVYKQAPQPLPPPPPEED